MSKNNPDFSDLDHLTGKEYTEEQRKELEKEEKEFLNQTTQPQAMDTFFEIPPVPAGSTSSFSALSGNIAGDGYVYPITEAIRKEILEKQCEEIRKHLLKKNAENPDLKANFENDEKFRDFLKTLNENKDNKDLIDNALNNPDLKKTLEGIELAGYKNVHNTFSADNYRENKIKEEQEELLRKYLNNDPAYAEEAKDKEKFRQFLANLNAGQRQGLYDKALSDTKFKEQYENVRREYANKYVGGFKPMEWAASADKNDQKREQVVRNGVGNEICTLTETTHNTKPMTVIEGGKTFTINSYRTIDFPVKLDEKASGTMHLSLVARDKDGNAPPVDKAVYFTAHYEASPPPDGIPKLKEVSSPQPLKFLGTGDDAVGYVEHGGEIYTLPVTKGNYEAMMREVAINKGQGVDVSQTIGQDRFKVQGSEKSVSSQQIAPANEKPITPQNTEIPKKPVAIVPPFNRSQQAEISQPQPQNPDSKGIIDEAAKLSKAMQDLLNEYMNNKGNKDVSEVAEKILGEKGASFDQKQAGINDLTKKLLGNKELPEELKIESLGKILDSINKNNVLSEPEKAKLLGGITSVVLDQDSLNQATKKQIVGKIADYALELNEPDARWQAINGITDAVLASNLDKKGEIFEVIAERIEASKHPAQEKSQLIGDVLDKGKKAEILSPEQQHLMQQNLDRIKEKQAAEEIIKSVQGILYDPSSDSVKKTEAIKSITVDVLDGPAKAEVKGEIIQGITKEVAQSPLDIKDKIGIIEVVGEAIASHKTLSVPDKATVASFAQDGIVKSTAELEDKGLMTRGLIDGIHKGIGNQGPEVASEITQGVLKSINAYDMPEEKASLEKVANSAIDTQSLMQDLNKDLSQNFVSSKFLTLRNILSASSNIKTIEEKKAESEKQINDLTKEFNTKSSTEDKLKFIQDNLIDNKDLSKDARLKAIDNLLQEQVEKRGMAVSGHSQNKTEDVKILSGKFELKPLSKDQPDIEKARMIVVKDKVNIKDNIQIMTKLTDAKNAIQSETAIVSKVPNNKKGPSFP